MTRFYYIDVSDGVANFNVSVLGLKTIRVVQTQSSAALVVCLEPDGSGSARISQTAPRCVCGDYESVVSRAHCLIANTSAVVPSCCRGNDLLSNCEEDGDKKVKGR